MFSLNFNIAVQKFSLNNDVGVDVENRQWEWRRLKGNALLPFLSLGIDSNAHVQFTCMLAGATAKDGAAVTCHILFKIIPTGF